MRMADNFFMTEAYLVDNVSTMGNSTNTTEADDPIHRVGVQAMFMICYTVIFVLGIFGNALTCYVVARNRTMQTVTNLFITNLALSDMLLCVLCVPFTPLYTFLGYWVFGRAMCYIVASAQSVSVYISTVTLTSIAVDRFFVIIYPFRQRMKISTCMVIVLGSWMYSLLVTLPYGIKIKYRYDANLNLTICEEDWPTDLNNTMDYRKVYGTVTTTMQFILPFLIIAFCYIKVSLKLNEQARAKPGTKNLRKEEIDRERKRRTNRMLIAMVSIFGLSWLPLNIVNILNDYNANFGHWFYYNLCFFSAHALAMSSTCYNPFLYAWLNENFRKEFKQVLPGFDTSRRRCSADRAGGWKSDKTCNGNETEATLFQSTSMIRRCSSIRIQLAEATKDIDKRNDLIDIENLHVTKATYNQEKEKVELHLSSDDAALLPIPAEDSRSSPPRDQTAADRGIIGTGRGQAV